MEIETIKEDWSFLAYLLPSVKLMSLKPTAEEAGGEVYIGGRVDQQRGEAGLVSRCAEYLDIEYTLAGLLQGARSLIVMVAQSGVVQW